MSEPDGGSICHAHALERLIDLDLGGLPVRSAGLTVAHAELLRVEDVCASEVGTRGGRNPVVEFDTSPRLVLFWSDVVAPVVLQTKVDENVRVADRGRRRYELLPPALPTGALSPKRHRIADLHGDHIVWLHTAE